MACERNRIIELNEYLSSLGISVNIGKNKARGHKGIFMRRFDNYRIDISKDIGEDNLVSVMLHEFAHYIHYNYDNTLSSLSFIFKDITDEIHEELLKITVHNVPKDFAAALYSKKECLASDLKILVEQMKHIHPDFKLSEKNTNIERNIKAPLKYLLKYDRVKYMGDLYSINSLASYDLPEDAKLYIKIKSKQRIIRRINSKISRLNKYYNSPSELFARFIESYYTNNNYTESTAPITSSLLKETENPYIKNLNNIFM